MDGWRTQGGKIHTLLSDSHSRTPARMHPYTRSCMHACTHTYTHTHARARAPLSRRVARSGAGAFGQWRFLQVESDSKRRRGCARPCTITRRILTGNSAPVLALALAGAGLGHGETVLGSLWTERLGVRALSALCVVKTRGKGTTQRARGTQRASEDGRDRDGIRRGRCSRLWGVRRASRCAAVDALVVSAPSCVLHVCVCVLQYPVQRGVSPSSLDARLMRRSDAPADKSELLTSSRPKTRNKRKPQCTRQSPGFTTASACAQRRSARWGTATT